MQLGLKIRGLRREQGLTLKAVSEQTGLSISFISDVERGRVGISLDSLVKVAVCLGITIVALFDGVDIGPSPEEAVGRPPGLVEFLTGMEGEGISVDPFMVKLMRGVRLLQSGRPQAWTAEEWKALYYALRAIAGS